MSSQPLTKLDWQAIVRRLGRSRTDFTFESEYDRSKCSLRLRLICNCCNQYAQLRICEHELLDTYYPDLVFAASVERLARYLLEAQGRDPKFSEE